MPTEAVIRVPPQFRKELVQNFDNVRIESDEDDDEWEPLREEEIQYLKTFLLGQYHGGPSKTWNVGSGVRLGYNDNGVFIHENHHKRFFGIPREHASIMLKEAVPEALPEFKMPSLSLNSGNSTEDLLGKLVHRMPSISDEMRDQVFMATFKAADTNSNNWLSRTEVGSLLRKVVGTISARDTEEMMHQVDTNRNNKVSYSEFVQWLRDKAPEKIVKKIKRSLRTEADIVRASFRAWDRNGDGLISQKEVHYVLKKHCPNLKQDDMETLIKTIDADKDGKIDYDEFIDFLFHKQHSR